MMSMEIKVSDLRVGNYLYESAYDECFNVYVVRGIQEDGVSLSAFGKNIKGLYDYKVIKSIPITEEWVVNLGFEWYEPLGHYRLVDEYDVWYQINVDEKNTFLFTFTALNYDEVNHMPPKVINYVHQLQNLFYFLAGKELKYENIN